MINQLKKNYLVLFESIILAILSFFLNFYIAAGLGPTQFGSLSLINTIIFTFLAVGSFVRKKPFLNKLKNYDINTLFPTLLLLNIFSSIIVSILLNIAIFIFKPEILIYTIIMSFIYLFNSATFLSVYYIFNEEGNKASLFKIGSVTIGLVLRFLLIYYEVDFIYLILSYVIEFLFLFILIIINANLNIKKMKFNKFILIEHLKVGYHLVVEIMIGKVSNLIMILSVTKFLGLSFLGKLIIAIRIQNVMGMLLVSIENVIYPHLIKIKDYKKTLMNAFKLYLIISLSLFIFIQIGLEPILMKFLKSDYNESIYIAKWLSISLLFTPFEIYMRTIILIKEQMDIIKKMNIFTLIYSIPAALILIPIYKEEGVIIFILGNSILYMIMLSFLYQKVNRT